MGGQAWLNTLRTNSSSATSPFASTTSHPYDRQFLVVFCDAASASPLLEHTMIRRAPWLAMWMARLPQRPFSPPTMRYDESGRNASVGMAGLMGSWTSSWPLEMTILPM